MFLETYGLQIRLSDDAHFKLALSFRIIAKFVRAAIDYRNSIKFCGFSTKPCQSLESRAFHYFICHFSNLKIHVWIPYMGMHCNWSRWSHLKSSNTIFRHMQFFCQSSNALPQYGHSQSEKKSEELMRNITAPPTGIYRLPIIIGRFRLFLTFRLQYRRPILKAYEIGHL